MSNDEQEIRDLVSTWMKSARAGDTATILSLMTDDVVFLLPGQAPMIGKETFAAAAHSHPDGAIPHIDGNSEIQEIEVHGDLAFMWTKLRVIVTPPGDAAPIVRAGHTLSILKKIHGKWLLARDANLLSVVANEPGA